jgi:hypothetical protein
MDERRCGETGTVFPLIFITFTRTLGMGAMQFRNHGGCVFPVRRPAGEVRILAAPGSRLETSVEQFMFRKRKEITRPAPDELVKRRRHGANQAPRGEAHRANVCVQGGSL